jgi:hypothetical protein
VQYFSDSAVRTAEAILKTPVPGGVKVGGASDGLGTSRKDVVGAWSDGSSALTLDDSGAMTLKEGNRVVEQGTLDVANGQLSTKYLDAQGAPIERTKAFLVGKKNLYTNLITAPGRTGSGVAGTWQTQEHIVRWNSDGQKVIDYMAVRNYTFGSNGELVVRNQNSGTFTNTYGSTQGRWSQVGPNLYRLEYTTESGHNDGVTFPMVEDFRMIRPGVLAASCGTYRRAAK